MNETEAHIQSYNIKIPIPSQIVAGHEGRGPWSNHCKVLKGCQNRERGAKEIKGR